jgi:hypothetical protein
MVSSITHGADTIYPQVVDGWSSTRTRPNRISPIVGSENVSVTARPAGLRRGTLRLIFGDAAATGSEYVIVDGIIVPADDAPINPAEEASRDAELLHATGTGVFHLSDPDRATLDLYYVVDQDGAITRELDDNTRAVWIVTVAFHEVSV